MPSQMIGIKLEAILPKDKNYTLTQFNNMINGLEKYMRGPLSSKMTGEFKKTTQGWKHTPNFVAIFTKPYNGARLQLWVKPTGRGTTNWSRISVGTGPRVINSSKGPMTFNVNYDPKTQPGGKWGGSGRRYGQVIYNKMSVGNITPHRIRPREFSKYIKDKNEKGIVSQMQVIVRKAIG
jgi:hypothetical protein